MSDNDMSFLSDGRSNWWLEVYGRNVSRLVGRTLGATVEMRGVTAMDRGESQPIS